MTEEDVIYYYMRDGEELITVSLNVAIARRDSGTDIYMQSGSKKLLVNIT